MFDSAANAGPQRDPRAARARHAARDARAPRAGARAHARQQPRTDATLRLPARDHRARHSSRCRRDSGCWSSSCCSWLQKSGAAKIAARPGGVEPRRRRRRLVDEALARDAGASRRLRNALRRVPAASPPRRSAGRRRRRQLDADDPALAAGARSARAAGRRPAPAAGLRLRPEPVETRLDTVGINEATLNVRWEATSSPVRSASTSRSSTSIPRSRGCYAPVDLNDPQPAGAGRLAPSEANPQFHQQMVYAVAMKTIEHFERALGRRRSGRRAPCAREGESDDERLRAAAAHLSARAARGQRLLQPGQEGAAVRLLPRAGPSAPAATCRAARVFTCLSHDIVAHETTHALLDGMHRRFNEPTNPDVLAFHEAFADIVALFQHFTLPEVLAAPDRAHPRRPRAARICSASSPQQFGAGDRAGTARCASAIGRVDDGRRAGARTSRPGRLQRTASRTPAARSWWPRCSTRSSPSTRRASPTSAHRHERHRRAAGGRDPPGPRATGWPRRRPRPPSHVLNMCIRALDYCPPVDITFGEYLRALITADTRPGGRSTTCGYRVAFVEAFRERGHLSA